MASSMRAPSRINVGQAIAWGVVVFVLAKIALNPDKYQWDLRVYYDAAVSFRNGIDPYVGGSKFKAGWPTLPYVYPPLVLYLFAPLAFASYGTAYGVWLALKIASLIVILRLWTKHFVPLKGNAFTVFFLLLAYSSALLWDVASGNIAMFEQLGLWLAFSQLVQGRTIRFAALIILVSQLKLVPAFFLLLLLFTGERPRWLLLLASVAAWLGVFSLNHLLQPQALVRFLVAAPALHDPGWNNCSPLALFQDVFKALEWTGPSVPGVNYNAFALGAAALVICVVGVVSARTLRKVRPTSQEQVRATVLFACTMLPILAPRFKNYSYILMLAPTLWLLSRGTLEKPLSWLLVLAALPSRYSPDPLNTPLHVLLPYLPLFAAMVAWWRFRGVLLEMETDGPRTEATASL